MFDLKDLWPFLGSNAGKILLIIVFAVIGHLLVILVKNTNRFVYDKFEHRTKPKWKSMISLITSLLIFSIYFVALGKILQEMGISLTTYLTSASIMGLAVGFGSQGIVQDIISGITLVFADLLDIGELVEIGGQVGYVESIGMRFVEIRNTNNARVYIPNRTISNVINYKQGYIKYYIDVQQIDSATNNAVLINNLLQKLSENIEKQAPGIFIEPFELLTNVKTDNKKQLSRIIFKIWPGRNTVLDKNFKQELLDGLKKIEPNYAEWMIANSAEIE